MELEYLIARLQKERAYLDEIITSLEELQHISAKAMPLDKKRRGRKFMDEAERQQVSQRMKSYWASRRQAKASMGI